MASEFNEDLAKEITVVVLKLVDLRHPKWSKGEGAYGRIDWNLARNELVHKHHRRTVTITTTEHRGL
ncbi:hypothetical protein [Peristeroidobacter soli]|uniref:hypothetical protein n=1 Tax=Peristeroidobacter soli TaxID=2497877 RepID=UPI00101BB582|nr:hypothetical protein [Peristeroidobacter soli]